MPPLRTYNLFISHAWSYRDAYHRLVDLLNGARAFQWKDYSVPEHDPLNTSSARALRAGLQRQMQLVHCVLAISGVYASHSNWMQEELGLANGFGKPVIAVAPRGSQRISGVVQDAAVQIVNWNTDSIVDAIRRHAL
jgi:hypothetical protein